MPCPLAHTMQAVHLHLLCPVLVVRSYHAPFTRTHIFRNVEAEYSHISDVALPLSLVYRFNGMGGFSNNEQMMFLCYGHDSIHVTRPSGKVDGNNGAGSLGDAFFYKVGVDIHGVFVNIDEYRFSPNMRDNIGRGGKGHGRGNNFVTLA